MIIGEIYYNDYEKNTEKIAILSNKMGVTHNGIEHNHHDSKSSHGHIHNEESQRKIINRLSRIEGHVRGIKTMVNEHRDCPEVLIQIAAIRGALDRVARMILDEHLSECITRAAEDGSIDLEIEALKAALDRFLP